MDSVSLAGLPARKGSLRSGLSAAVGCDVSAAFAAGQACPALATGQFYFAEVPAGLRPESVLERLSALRGK